MGDWNLLGGILEEVHIHSTVTGKIWLTILFLFRILVLGVAAEGVWKDEQSDFICNTEQPGCRNACYDQAFPISLIRYWVLQVIFVSSPSLVYMGHALYQLRVLEKQRQRMKAQLRRELSDGIEFKMPVDQRRLEQELCQLEQRKLNKAPLRGTLLCTYVIHICIRSVVEAGFMIGQYLLYGFRLEPLFKCHGQPCPHRIDCFVSRPTEKTVFLLFMQSIATVSLLLNILEISHLGFKKITKGLWGRYKLKNEHSEFYANKSKQNLAKYQSTSPNSLKRFPSEPDYNLSMKKQTDGLAYLSLNASSVLQADHGNHSVNGKKCILDEQETTVMCTLNTTCTYPQHIRANNQDTHKIFAEEPNGNPVREKRQTDGKDGKKSPSFRDHCSVPGTALDTDNHMRQSPQEDCFLAATCTWKPGWLGATRMPSKEDEKQGLRPKGNLQGQLREGTVRTLPLSQEDSQPLDITNAPDPLGEWPFEPMSVRTCNNPTVCPTHLMPSRNNYLSRRVSTDLQI